MKASNIMIPLQCFLKSDNTLKEAANLLRTVRTSYYNNTVKGLPVLDENEMLIGMLSMRDILKAVYPAYMYMMNLGEFTWDGMFEEMAKKAADCRVKDYMTKEVVTIRADCTLMECIDCFLKHKIQRLPVLDKSGKVIGMIYQSDIFSLITCTMMDMN